MTDGHEDATPLETKPTPQRVPRWALALIVGLSFISTASAGVAVVTVTHSNGEHGRTCASITKGIDLAVDGIFSVPQRSSLPPRTPAEDAQRRASLKITHAGIDQALEKC